MMNSNWLRFGGKVVKVSPSLIGGDQAVIQTDIGELIGVRARNITVGDDGELYVKKGSTVVSLGEDEL